MNGTHAAVNFDMDGVLVDSEPLYMRAWQEAASELGFLLTREAYCCLIGLAEEDYQGVVQELLGAMAMKKTLRRWMRGRCGAAGMTPRCGWCSEYPARSGRWCWRTRPKRLRPGICSVQRSCGCGRRDDRDPGMSQSHSGGCLCGALRFTAAADPLDSGYCNCTLCRRPTGAPLAAYVSSSGGVLPVRGGAASDLPLFLLGSSVSSAPPAAPRSATGIPRVRGASPSTRAAWTTRGLILRATTSTTATGCPGGLSTTTCHGSRSSLRMARTSDRRRSRRRRPGGTSRGSRLPR